MKDAIRRDVPGAKKGLYPADVRKVRTLTLIVENAIKEDILNRLAKPSHLPRSDYLRCIIKTIVDRGRALHTGTDSRDCSFSEGLSRSTNFLF